MPHDHRNNAGNEDLIKRLFNKVYTAIISEKIFCPPETAVYLAAVACQAKFGPAKSLRNPVPPVKELLPKSTLDNHNLSINEWEERISKWHLKLRDTSFMDAIVEYLDIAQDVELYGASVFEVEAQSQVRKWISLDAVGLNIYDSKRKPPTKRYVWSDISSFTAVDDKIEIELVHRPKQIIEFVAQSQQIGKLLEGLFLGSKELYSRRKKDDVSFKYVRRSESNSSMRMRPRKLTAMELLELEQQIAELELELPRQATGYEYAAWQVKDQLRQARGIETKLSLSVPPTDETRQLQHRVAQIRVFLEQDFFKEKEPANRLHRYRGNFAIRIGGTLASRSDDYASDVDSGSENNYADKQNSKAPVWTAGITAKTNSNNVKNAAPIWTLKSTPEPISQPSSGPSVTPNSVRSSALDTEAHGYVGHSYNSDDNKLSNPTMPLLPESLLPTNSRPVKPPTSNTPPKPVTYNPDAFPKLPVKNAAPIWTLKSTPEPISQPSSGPSVTPNSVRSSALDTEAHGYVGHSYNANDNKLSNPTMPSLPESLLPTNSRPVKPPTSNTPPKPVTYNPDAYPKLPETSMKKFFSGDQSLTTTNPFRGGSGYPEARGSEEVDPPASVDSPQTWKHILRTPDQEPLNQYARGRIHGQTIESENVQMAYRPPVQPKPKVAPRGTADPLMVTPDYYTDAAGSQSTGIDPKFSSLKVIQSGYTKKRVDLFEAL
ncbi:hypothetical protein Aperf_G00000054009 [Anoplocephala perfoliata]